MRTASKTFLQDCRGASVPEYGLVLFAVLLAGAVATRTLGGGVQRNGDVARRILEGENIRLSGAGNPAPGSGSTGSGGSSDGTAADGTGNGAANGSSGGSSDGAGGSGGAVASAGGSSSGGSGAGGGGSSGDPSAIGGGVVLGASGASTGSTGGSTGSSSGEAAGSGTSGSTVGSIVGGGEGEATGGGVGSDLGGATADSAHGSGGSSSGTGSSTSSGSTGSSSSSSRSGAAQTILGALFNAVFGSDDSSSSSGSSSTGSTGSTTSSSGGSSIGGLGSTSTRAATTSRGGAVEDKLPGAKSTTTTSPSTTSKTGVLGASNAPKNNVNPPPPESETDTRGGTTQTIDGHTFTVSAAGERQMAALAAKAAANAGAKRPKGWCYHQVKVDIQEVGYGSISKQTANAQLRPLPGSDQGEAHDFADYMNARGANGQTNASNLGLQKLSITNPYDAPKGAIIVVRAGTPGTHNPTAGDIVVAGGNGKFYNDGNMGYGGSKNFKPGNNYVLGIYVPK